jgi:hypothetical protein
LNDRSLNQASWGSTDDVNHSAMSGYERERDMARDRTTPQMKLCWLGKRRT